jgi:hypothetical protein
MPYTPLIWNVIDGSLRSHSLVKDKEGTHLKKVAKTCYVLNFNVFTQPRMVCYTSAT